MFKPTTRILIVDDMPAMRKIMTRCLKQMGFQSIVECTDGANAWERLSEPGLGIDLVISDWNMPVSKGIDLLKRIRSDSRLSKMPFLMVTAEAEVEQVKEAIEAGTTGYVLKPFDMATLTEKLAEVYRKANAA